MTTFNEADHPRDKDGKFAKAGGGRSLRKGSPVVTKTGRSGKISGQSKDGTKWLIDTDDGKKIRVNKENVQHKADATPSKPKPEAKKAVPKKKKRSEMTQQERYEAYAARVAKFKKREPVTLPDGQHGRIISSTSGDVTHVDVELTDRKVVKDVPIEGLKRGPAFKYGNLGGKPSKPVLKTEKVPKPHNRPDKVAVHENSHMAFGYPKGSKRTYGATQYAFIDAREKDGKIYLYGAKRNPVHTGVRKGARYEWYPADNMTLDHLKLGGEKVVNNLTAQDRNEASMDQLKQWANDKAAPRVDDEPGKGKSPRQKQAEKVEQMNASKSDKPNAQKKSGGRVKPPKGFKRMPKAVSPLSGRYKEFKEAQARGDEWWPIK